MWLHYTFLISLIQQESLKNHIYLIKQRILSLSSNDNKRMESIDSKETYVYGTRKDLASEKEETKYNNLKNGTKND